jgi:hypothetical protein
VCVCVLDGTMKCAFHAVKWVALARQACGWCPMDPSTPAAVPVARIRRQLARETGTAPTPPAPTPASIRRAYEVVRRTAPRAPAGPTVAAVLNLDDPATVHLVNSVVAVLEASVRATGVVGAGMVDAGLAAVRPPSDALEAAVALVARFGIAQPSPGDLFRAVVWLVAAAELLPGTLDGPTKAAFVTAAVRRVWPDAVPQALQFLDEAVDVVKCRVGLAVVAAGAVAAAVDAGSWCCR